MNRLGFMQGRLTDKGGFYPQQFPTGQWEKEFEVAVQVGFQCMEWMFNFEQWRENPVINKEGIRKISNLVNETGIAVSGICANYFMHRNIFDSCALEENAAILRRLVKSAELLECPNIVIPLFEASEFRLENGIMRKILESISSASVNILLETDCDIKILREWLEKIGNQKVGLCYDIGNAAGLGRNTVQEMEEYADIIQNIHIKDKKRQGSTVMLGQGDARIGESIKIMYEKGYAGCFILESYYGENAIEDTTKNYYYIKDFFEK